MASWLHESLSSLSSGFSVAETAKFSVIDVASAAVGTMNGIEVGVADVQISERAMPEAASNTASTDAAAPGGINKGKGKGKSGGGGGGKNKDGPAVGKKPGDKVGADLPAKKGGDADDFLREPHVS